MQQSFTSPSSYPTLFTERLVLKPVSLTRDAGGLHEIYRDPESMKFMPTLPHKDVEETKQSMERYSLKEVNWSIYLRREGEGEGEGQALVGSINYHLNSPIPGLGYIIKRSEWGRGFASEAAVAALRYGFAPRRYRSSTTEEEEAPPVTRKEEYHQDCGGGGLGLDKVELWIDERNTASEKVAFKLGFTRNGSIEQLYNHESTHHLMFTYGMTKETFLQKYNRCSSSSSQQQELQEDEERENPTAGTAATPRVFRAQAILQVNNVHETAKLYQKVFGCRIDFLWPSPPALEGETPPAPTHGAVSFGHWTGQGASFQLSGSSDGGSGGDGMTVVERPQQYLFLETKGFDEYFNRIENEIIAAESSRLAMKVVSPPENKPWGMREFVVLDIQNGHLFKFGTNI